MANIKDIARLSGVAPSTVSAVLTGKTDRVKSSTRERVIEVMRELRYVPSPLFYGNHAETTMSIGVVLFASYEPDDEVLDPYYMSILEGILAVGIRRGWNITSTPVRSWDNCIRTLRVYFDGRCNGLLLLNPKGREEIIDALLERNFPFVLVNSERDNPACNCVGIDLALGAHRSIDHLYSLGHRRIALLAGNGEVDTRADVYRDFMGNRSLPVLDAMMPAGGFTAASGRERAHSLLTELKEPPTAFFCDTDEIASGALIAAQNLGLDVPGDVSVIGFDDVPLASATNPPLTTIRRPLCDIGKAATRMIIDQIGDGNIPPQTLHLPAELIVRGTTGPVRAA